MLSTGPLSTWNPCCRQTIRRLLTEPSPHCRQGRPHAVGRAALILEFMLSADYSQTINRAVLMLSTGPFSSWNSCCRQDCPRAVGKVILMLSADYS